MSATSTVEGRRVAVVRTVGLECALSQFSLSFPPLQTGQRPRIPYALLLLLADFLNQAVPPLRDNRVGDRDEGTSQRVFRAV